MPDVAREILMYFQSRPTAADDVTGIARWRLLRQQLGQTVEQTRASLKWLTEKGFLLEIGRPGATSLFRMNPDKADEAGRLLERSRTKSD